MFFNPLSYIVSCACIKTVKARRINDVNKKRHRKSDHQIAKCPRRPRSIGVEPAHPEQSGLAAQDFNPEQSGLRVYQFLPFKFFQNGSQEFRLIFQSFSKG